MVTLFEDVILALENDINELKKKALESGVPYQSIIRMLIHRFVSNKIQMGVYMSKI